MLTPRILRRRRLDGRMGGRWHACCRWRRALCVLTAVPTIRRRVAPASLVSVKREGLLGETVLCLVTCLKLIFTYLK